MLFTSFKEIFKNTEYLWRRDRNFCFVFIERRCLTKFKMEMSKKQLTVVILSYHSRQNIMDNSLVKNL